MGARLSVARYAFTAAILKLRFPWLREVPGT